jgi:uroporphyrinogen-III synthase
LSSKHGPRLSGVRVWVTRPEERVQELCFLLEDEGARVFCLPLLELAPPADVRPLRAAAERMERYQWVVFSSRSAVSALVEAAREAGTLGRLEKIKIAAIGPGTARVVSSYGFQVSIQAAEATGQGLFESLQAALLPADEILLPVAEKGRGELEEALASRGIRTTRVVAYRSVAPSLGDAQKGELKAFEPQIVMVASPRTAESFHENLGDLGPELVGGLKVVAIGPTTAAAVQALGLSLAAVASRPTPHGLVDAAVEAMGRRSAPM